MINAFELWKPCLWIVCSTYSQCEINDGFKYESQWLALKSIITDFQECYKYLIRKQMVKKTVRKFLTSE